MQVQFKLTFEDYLQAQRLHSKRNWQHRLWFVLSRTLVPALGLLYLLLFVVILWRTTPSVWLFVALVCGSYFPFYPLFVRLRLRRCYRRTRTGDDWNFVEVSEESIHINAENSRSDLNWKAVQSWREDKNVILLYLAIAKFIVLPKRAFSPEQINELHSLLSRNVQSAIQNRLHQ